MRRARSSAWAGSASSASEPLHRLVQPRVGPGGQADLGEVGLDRLGLAGHRPQRVQGGDVARALPDRLQRRLPVQPGHAGLLHVAVAAEALQRLGRVHRDPLAHPVLGRRPARSAGTRPPARRRGRRGRSPRPAAAPPWSRPRTRPPGRPARWPSRLVGQVRPNACRCAAWNAAWRRRAASGGGRDHAVQPGHVDHLDDGRDAPALLADQPGHRVVVLDLGRGVGLVAELVLEPLQPHTVAGAVRQHPRQQEAGQARRGAWARTRNRSFMGAEVNHLWPVSR